MGESRSGRRGWCWMRRAFRRHLLAEMFWPIRAGVTYVCDASEIQNGVSARSAEQQRMMFEKRFEPIAITGCPPFTGKTPLSISTSSATISPDRGPGVARRTTGDFDLEVDAVVLVTSRTSDERCIVNSRHDARVEGRMRFSRYFASATARPHAGGSGNVGGPPAGREFDGPQPAHPLPWIRERQLWGADTAPSLGDPRPGSK